jgi:hypothetical protein
MNACPYCGFEVPDGDTWAEIVHMQTEHPDIIDQRLREVGMIGPDEHVFAGETTNLIQVIAGAIANALDKRGMGVSMHMPGDERIDFYEGIAREVIVEVGRYAVIERRL